MRRNIITKNYLNYIWIVLLLGYVPLVSIYAIFPPLIGVMYLLFLKHRDNGYFLFFISIYFLLYEIGFLLASFSTITIFFILRYALDGIFPKVINCVKCFYIGHIILVYIGYFVLMYVLSFTINVDYISINYVTLLYYIAIESLISILVINE